MMHTKLALSAAVIASLTLAPSAAFAEEPAANPETSTAVVQSAAEALGFDPGTIAEELASEINTAITDGVIKPEIIKAVIEAAADPVETQSLYDSNLDTSTEDWKSEEDVWLEAESEVASSVTESCVDDPTCKTEIGKTIAAVAVEGVLAQVQARVDSALALPPQQRGEALQEMGKDIRELRARMQRVSGSSAGDDGDRDDSVEDIQEAQEFLERRGVAVQNVSDLDADIMERLAEALTGDDDILEVGFDDDERSLIKELEEERRENAEEERRENAEEAEEERRENAEEAEEERRENAEEERRENAEEATDDDQDNDDDDQDNDDDDQDNDDDDQDNDDDDQ
jgi:hypothetical protein